MENIPLTFDAYLKQLYKEFGKLSFVHMGGLFYHIALVLHKLEKRYGFQHCDLHGGNIMITRDARVKIIDFGMSCMNYNGTRYSVDYENTQYDGAFPAKSCMSYDLLILISWLTEYKSEYFDVSVLRFLYAMSLSKNGYDFYEYVGSLSVSKPIFHGMYMNQIAKWPSDIRKELIYDTPTLRPDEFLFQLDTHTEFMNNAKISNNSRMPNTRKNHRGGGYGTSQQMFNPGVLPPTALIAAPSTAPTADAVRPVLLSTFQTGGTRSKRRSARGGFSPSVMGGFMANAQAAIVPLALYALYRTVAPPKTRKSGGKHRKNSRKNSRKH